MAEIKTKHGLPETKGSFKSVGLVSGVKKEDFFVSKETKKGDERNTVKFGVKTSSENEIFVQMADQERDNVYFFRRKDEKKGWKKKTEKVPWSDRHTFNEDGFNLIGVAVGIEKEEVEGKVKNVTKYLHPFDGAKYIDDLATQGEFTDNMPVRVMGDIEFSSFETDKGEKIRFKRFEAKKVYNSRVDFEADDFAEECDFKQQFIYMSTEMKKDDDGKPYALVAGKVVTYSTIEDVEFVIRNKKLATNFQKRLKPYTSVVVFGKIVNRAVVEEVVVEDDWGGESDPFEKANKSYKFEMEIHGIKTDDIDTETYTKEKVEDAMRAEDDFGKNVDSDDWGSDDDDDGEWD